MSPAADDASLVEATLQGDQSSFAELARRYRDAAFGIAFHKLGDFESARDAAQEALVTAYVELPMLRDPSKFGHWLYRITTMAALAQLRRRRAVVSLDDIRVSEPETNSAEFAERAEKARQVRDALASLPEPEQLAVILHYVNGYSHEEIGGMLGTSTSAVKSRVHRAKGKLREELHEMVEKNLKKSTLEQFNLKPLKFWVWYGFYHPDYADILQIKVTHVYGKSDTIEAGETYVVRGEYTFTGTKEIPLRLVVSGTSTANIPTIQPGSGKFEISCKVHEVKPNAEHSLAILMPDDKSLIQINLGEELNLRPLRFSTTEAKRDPKYAQALQVKVTEVLGTSPVVAPGEVYAVVGEYTLTEPLIPILCLTNTGESWGFITHITPGTHQFAATANVLKVTPGKDDRLVLHTPGIEADTIPHLSIRLKGWAG